MTTRKLLLAEFPHALPEHRVASATTEFGWHYKFDSLSNALFLYFGLRPLTEACFALSQYNSYRVVSGRRLLSHHKDGLRKFYD